jgi:hypothetical protein
MWLRRIIEPSNLNTGCIRPFSLHLILSAFPSRIELQFEIRRSMGYWTEILWVDGWVSETRHRIKLRLTKNQRETSCMSPTLGINSFGGLIAATDNGSLSVSAPGVFDIGDGRSRGDGITAREV